ncbi:hypothetical protein SAMN05421821_105345 [Mucilaginibacter lappiensis]|uniref:Uncharacterized protein n=1 Tax=Mucilaginibacter lappiensis TaxID=354630 RepID=A0A1N6YZR2_9SPHI|nr:hypothetical protein [Mucilaginibacter lappiensis]MBB6131231.1 hypothetical protein [Mucilaginibacter lappiensis]SIR20122.1 hypothetical protein SAMN05421821_105345 [Mucilaginibacter lappiensis]
MRLAICMNMFRDNFFNTYQHIFYEKVNDICLPVCSVSAYANI